MSTLEVQLLGLGQTHQGYTIDSMIRVVLLYSSRGLSPNIDIFDLGIRQFRPIVGFLD